VHVEMAIEGLQFGEKSDRKTMRALCQLKHRRIRLSAISKLKHGSFTDSCYFTVVRIHIPVVAFAIRSIYRGLTRDSALKFAVIHHLKGA